MTINTSGFSTDTKVNGQSLKSVSMFKYLGATVTDECSKPEIMSRIAQTTSAFTPLKPIWKDKNITLRWKVKLMRSLLQSGVSSTEHVTNTEVRQKITQAIGPHDDLLDVTMRRKLRWYGHVTRSDGLAMTILQGTVPGSSQRASGQQEPKRTGLETIRGAPTTLHGVVGQVKVKVR
ncbi:uncharacterized protein LOC143297098 [Babylonia areolata]|uniref:uncharacterized protein LOC143297098 n=1 Tax=Babylonia areolata TaxID=304850 RepID=UPI003FD5786D